MKKNREYYNAKISARANACIQERQAVVRIQKCVLAIAFILCISFFILFYNDMNIFANGNKDTYKNNNDICIEESEMLLEKNIQSDRVIIRHSDGTF